MIFCRFSEVNRSIKLHCGSSGRTSSVCDGHASSVTGTQFWCFVFWCQQKKLMTTSRRFKCVPQLFEGILPKYLTISKRVKPNLFAKVSTATEHNAQRNNYPFQKDTLKAAWSCNAVEIVNMSIFRMCFKYWINNKFVREIKLQI